MKPITENSRFLLEPCAEEPKGSDTLYFRVFGCYVSVKVIPEGDERPCRITEDMLIKSGLSGKNVVGLAIKQYASEKYMNFYEFARVLSDDGECLGYEKIHSINTDKRVCLRKNAVIVAQVRPLLASSISFIHAVTSEETRVFLKKVSKIYQNAGLFLYPVKLRGKPWRVIIIPDIEGANRDLLWYMHKKGEDPDKAAVYYYRNAKHCISVLSNVKDCLNGSPERELRESYHVRKIREKANSSLLSGNLLLWDTTQTSKHKRACADT